MNTFEWVVIGAGPAGIACVGQLIDKGVNPKTIAWVDPVFNVGDLGDKWSTVPSNTSVDLFLRFLAYSPAFEFNNSKPLFHLQTLPLDNTCELRWVVEPLAWVTEVLSKKVNALKTMIQRLWLSSGQWMMQTEKGDIVSAKHVILATGALPNSLDYSALPSIPLEVALNPERLREHCSPKDSVAVFGSSHSAVLVIRNLLDCGVKKVINFYQNPLRFAVQLPEGILFDNTGLKGEAAQWARQHLQGQTIPGLARYGSNEATIQQHLPTCESAVYAVGFTRRHVPIIGFEKINYLDTCGIIAPGLFGCGIAFPERVEDPVGNVESNVGLWKFMRYLDRVIPLWKNYGIN